MTVPDDKATFVAGAPVPHLQRSSVQHWQLKDLLVCNPACDRELFTVYHSHVAAYNLKTRSATKALRDISFQPTCMTAADGYVAVGGQRSQVVVRELASDWRASTTIGGAINNCVHIASHAGTLGPRLFVCNNDETCKIFQLPAMDHVATIRLPTAVNGVAVSPDGSMVVVVGDTNQVFLYAVGRAGAGADRAYERVATLTSGRDAGFSCAWDQTSQRFAVGCQDACVCVWDVRMISTAAVAERRTASGALSAGFYGAPIVPTAAESLSPIMSSLSPAMAQMTMASPTLSATSALSMSPRPSPVPSAGESHSRKLAQIASTQSSGRGAVRAVKFARGGSVDLLAFSEHQSYVNVVDARTFAGRESLRVATGMAALGGAAAPQAAGDVNITGLAFSPDSSAVLVATEHAVLEYAVDTRRRRVFGSGQIM